MGPWCRRPVSGRSQSDAGVVDGARSVPVDPAVVAAIPRDKPWLRAELEREPDGWLLSHDAGSSPLRAKSLGEAVTARPPPGHQCHHPHFPAHTRARHGAHGCRVDVNTTARRGGHTAEVMLRGYSLGAEILVD